MGVCGRHQVRLRGLPAPGTPSIRLNPRRRVSWRHALSRDFNRQAPSHAPTFALAANVRLEPRFAAWKGGATKLTTPTRCYTHPRSCWSGWLANQFRTAALPQAATRTRQPTFAFSDDSPGTAAVQGGRILVPPASVLANRSPPGTAAVQGGRVDNRPFLCYTGR